jgi:hypothetical protein
MKELGHSSQVAGEIPLCSFWHTFSTPSNEDILGETGVGVRHLNIGELHSSFREFLDQIGQFTLYKRFSVQIGLVISIH